LFDISPWYGVLAPAGTPKPVIDRLHGEISRILGMPDFKEYLTREGFETRPNTPDEFRRFIAVEIEKYSRIIAASGARVE
jgi:tripartite-type tricarboxylate transporter receptor subunit TctC